MATWLKHTLTGFIGAVIIAGCTITTSTDDDDDFDGFDDFDGDAGSAPRAGSGGRGGSGAGGARAGSGVGGSRAGAGGSAGTAGTAGTAGSAPDDGLPDDLVCGGAATEPADSCEFAGAAPGYSDCQACLSTNCCDAVKDCYGTEPSDGCGWGGRDGVPEWLCYVACLVEIVDTQEFFDPEVDREECLLSCGTPTDGLGNACTSVLPTDSTHELTNCINDKCETECVYEVADNN